MMGVERVIKLESDTDLSQPPYLDFSAFTGRNRVACDWKTQPESSVKSEVNVRIGG